MNCLRPRLISRCAAASSSVSSLSLSYLGCSWQSFLSWASTLSFFTSSTVASASSSSPSISSTILRCTAFGISVHCSLPDDDGVQPQVLHLPRGVHLRRHRHLPRHHQHFPLHPQNRWSSKKMRLKSSFIPKSAISLCIKSFQLETDILNNLIYSVLCFSMSFEKDKNSLYTCMSEILLSTMHCVIHNVYC